MKLEHRSPDTLTLSDRNPPSRTSDWNMRDMNKSMETYGFIPDYAVSIDPDGVVRKGHRRVTASQRLQSIGDARFYEIPCLVVDNGTPYSDVRDADLAQKKLSVADHAYIYLRNPNEVPRARKSAFALFEKALGKSEFKRRVEMEEIQPGAMSCAKCIYRWCILQGGPANKSLKMTYRDLGFLEKAYRLFVDNKLQGTFNILRHEYKEGNVDVAILMQCVDEQDPTVMRCVRRR